MMIYIDHEMRCHVADDGTGRPVKTDFFEGKCPAFVEGYRYIPAGETWIREDGQAFTGEMIAPWKDYAALSAAQFQYEADLAALKTAYEEGVNSL